MVRPSPLLPLLFLFCALSRAQVFSLPDAEPPRFHIHQIGKKYKMDHMLPYYIYPIQINQSSLKNDTWYFVETHLNDAQSLSLEISPSLHQDIHIYDHMFQKSKFATKYGVSREGTPENDISSMQRLQDDNFMFTFDSGELRFKMKRKTQRPLLLNLLLYKTSSSCHFYDYPTFLNATAEAMSGNWMREKCLQGSYFPKSHLTIQITENPAFSLSKLGEKMGLQGFVFSIVWVILLLSLSFLFLLWLGMQEEFGGGGGCGRQPPDRISVSDFVFLFVEMVGFKLPAGKQN